MRYLPSQNFWKQLNSIFYEKSPARSRGFQSHLQFTTPTFYSESWGADYIRKTCLARDHKPSKKCQYVYYIMTLIILIFSEWSLLFFFGGKLLEHTKNTLNINLGMLPDTKSLLHWFTVLHHVIFYSCSYFTAHHSQEGIVSLLAIKKCVCSTAFSKEQWG